MDPETGARHTALTPAEQDELAAMDQAVEARYQQIKDDPDALTRYANASPAYGPTSALTDIALTPALGAAAGGAATRERRRWGRGENRARRRLRRRHRRAVAGRSDHAVRPGTARPRRQGRAAGLPAGCGARSGRRQRRDRRQGPPKPQACSISGRASLATS